jgi:biopolymer transport protein ExbD
MGAKLSGGGGRKGAPAANSEPNVVPFIDVLLVLLIIFMVAAPIPTVDVKVDLPPPQPPRPQTVVERPPEPVFVGLMDLGGGEFDVYVDNVLTPLPRLREAVLAAIQANDPTIANVFQGRILVRAQQSLAYGSVMQVVSDLQEANFTRVGLLTEEVDPNI